jgi:hypothetical protein
MKSVFKGGCVVATMAVLVSVPGIAAADGDPFQGMTYANASAQVAKLDKSAKIVVSTVVGSLLQRDDCLVTHWTKAAILDGTGTKSGVTVFMDLNCNGVLASAGTPGNSSASPQGRTEKAKQETLDYLNAHPEFCNENPQNHDNCVKYCKDIQPGKCTFELG